MAYLKFPIYFCEDDFEKKENLGLKVEHTQGEICINTQMICAYNAMDNGNVLVRSANGDCYEIPMDIESFENLLAEVDSIFDLKDVLNEN